MIFSNLAGTTNNQFKINGDGAGQLLSNNAYDLFWACQNPTTNSVNPNVKLLPAGANLDDYRLFIHMGQWYSTLIVTETLTNLPDGITAEFTLLILTNSGNWDGYVRQEIVTNDGVKFERRFNGFKTPSWSAWKQVAYTPEMGSFTLVPYDATIGNSGDITGVRFTMQRNKYYIVSNIVFMFVLFRIDRLSSSSITGPLGFKGIPVSIAYGFEIFGTLNMTGNINNVNGVPITFYPTQPYGSMATLDSFSVLCGYNASSDKTLLAKSYLYVDDLSPGTSVNVVGSMTIYMS